MEEQQQQQGVEEGVGRAFVDHYYYLFDNDRSSLCSLYHPSSMLTFEGHKVEGVHDISRKLNLLPFHQCQHVISTIDSQPSSSFTSAIIVFVSGSLKLPGEDHQLRFSQVPIYIIHLKHDSMRVGTYYSSIYHICMQMFHLVPSSQGSYFVQNDIFRLNYGWHHPSVCALISSLPTCLITPSIWSGNKTYNWHYPTYHCLDVHSSLSLYIYVSTQSREWSVN